MQKVNLQINEKGLALYFEICSDLRSLDLDFTSTVDFSQDPSNGTKYVERQLFD